MASQSPLPLPTVKDKRSIIPSAHPDPSINLNNIQGDVYPTFPKKAERFIFFIIRDDKAFRKDLKNFTQYITTAADVVNNLRKVQDARLKNKGAPKPLPKERLVRLEQYQIGFSHAAFKHLNITGEIGDDNFKFGPQINSAKALLGDKSTGLLPREIDWDEVWIKHAVHGVIVAASESEETCEEQVARVRETFADSIQITVVEGGQVRPGAEEGHEHFGYLDGISQPAIIGLADPHPGQRQCEPGVIIMGGKNDPVVNRPDWTEDGSIMVFRKLKQLVPEFDKFLRDNPLNEPGLSAKDASELRGAKMVGRWKSGAPVQLSPHHDDPALGADPDRNNTFDYSEHGLLETQVGCPFSAHIRKSAPRKTIPESITTQAMIVRAAIPYGPEVSEEERAMNATVADRGLLFAAYQSSLDLGFVFIQTIWANDVVFPRPFTGFDPIIGNRISLLSRVRDATGQNPIAPLEAEILPNDFVVARGGEYFFIPSMSTLEKIANGVELKGGLLPPIKNPIQPIVETIKEVLDDIKVKITGHA